MRGEWGYSGMRNVKRKPGGLLSGGGVLLFWRCRVQGTLEQIDCFLVLAYFSLFYLATFIY